VLGAVPEQDPGRARGLKIEIGRTTVANVLAEAASNRRRSAAASGPGSNFSGATGTLSAPCDFFSVETLGVFGTVRCMVFFVVELKSRRSADRRDPHHPLTQ
jgi:hypothetical protein